MKRLLYLSAAAALLFACTNIDTIPEIQETLADDVIVSKVSGQSFPAASLYPDVLVVKFSESCTDEIESLDADVIRICEATKSSSNPLKLIKPKHMERLFPHAGEFEPRTRAEGLHRWYKVQLPEGVSLADAEYLFANSLEVECVEFDRKVVQEPYTVTEVEPASARQDVGRRVNYPFNDPLLSKQWHYYNDGSRSGSVASCDINVLPVWESYSPGASDVIVGVVDGGINYTHEDLADNMWTGDGGIHGYDFIYGETIDPDNHGTHVGGTIAAVNNNGKGVCGVAGGNAAAGIPGVKIMSCQIFSKRASQEGKGADTPRAIKWSCDHGAVISQNSWGYDYDFNNDGEITGEELEAIKNATIPSSLKEAIDYFVKYAGCDNNGNQLPNSPMKGGLVVFAAGNDNVPYCNPSYYDKIMAVTSVGSDYRRAYYSSYGDWADIIAPGGDVMKGFQVLSTLPGNKYGDMQGTSMACPHVSGVAALIVANLGGEGFTVERLRELLLGTASSKVLEYNTLPMGVGLVNAADAIDGNRSVVHDLTLAGPDKMNVKLSQTKELVVEVNNPTGHSLNIELSPKVPGVSYSIASPKQIAISINGTEVAQGKYDEDHNYSFTLSVTCEQEPDESHSVGFSVTVPANQAPILLRTLNGIAIDELNGSTRINLNNYFLDPDGGSLSYEISECDLGSFKIVQDQVTFNASNYGTAEVQIKAQDAFGASISGTLPILVRDGKSRNIDIYPNPVSDVLYIRGSSEFEGNVTLQAANGKKVISEKIKSTPFEPAGIDVRALGAGIYTVTVDDGKNVFSQRITKY